MHNDRDVDDENRGKITNRERARQQIDFSGLRIGRITPTDIDQPSMWEAVDYKNKAYIFGEYKYEDATMTSGQRLFQKRHTDDLEHRKPTLFFIASHNTHDPNEDIDAANVSVREWRLKGKWIPFNSEHPELILTVRKLQDLFLANLELESEDFKFLCISESDEKKSSNRARMS